MRNMEPKYDMYVEIKLKYNNRKLLQRRNVDKKMTKILETVIMIIAKYNTKY